MPSHTVSSTTILLLSALPLIVHAQEDPFYDNSPFPGTTQSTFRTSSIANAATNNEATCHPTTYTFPRNYTLISEPGPGCVYQSWVEYAQTTPSPTSGPLECASHCDDSASCRGYHWTLDSADLTIGECFLRNHFYEPGSWPEGPLECGTEGSSTVTYLGIYDAVDWTPPEELVLNGGFETGCLEPWFFSDFTSDESMVPVVVDCVSAGGCAVNGGASYFRVTGNGENGGTRDKIDAYIGQKPALEDDVVYRLSASVRGPVGGEVRFTYPAHTSVKIRVSTTGEWQEVDGLLDGRNTGTFLIQMDAPAAANFAIDNVKIEAV